MKTHLLTILLMLFATQNIFAKEQFKELSFNIKDNMSSKQNNESIEIESSNIYIKIKGYDIDDFDANKVMNKLDGMIYNLKEYKLIDEKKEPFYLLDKDFTIKYYENAKGGKLITYTCYGDIPYSLAGIYSSDSDLADIMYVIDSIELNTTWWNSIWRVFKNSFWMISLIFAALAFIRFVKVYLAMIAGVVFAFIAFFGDWQMCFSFAVIFALFALIAHPKILEAIGD